MFTLDQLTAAEKQFYELVTNCSELKVGSRMPTLSEQDYLISMLQNELHLICVNLKIHYFIKPLISYRFEINSINIGISWDCVK